MQGGLFLDVVVREGTAILSCMLAKIRRCWSRGMAFFVLDLRFHVVDGIRRLDPQRDVLASERLDENLHATTQTEN